MISAIDVIRNVFIGIFAKWIFQSDEVIAAFACDEADDGRLGRKRRERCAMVN
jgi:hypothetical protein